MGYQYDQSKNTQYLWRHGVLAAVGTEGVEPVVHHRGEVVSLSASVHLDVEA